MTTYPEIDIVSLATTDYLTSQKSGLEREIPALARQVDALRSQIEATDLIIRAKKCQLAGISRELLQRQANSAILNGK